MVDLSPEQRAELDELCARDDREAPELTEAQLARLRELLVPKVARPSHTDID
jgi:hypothetical protein